MEMNSPASVNNKWIKSNDETIKMIIK